MLTLAVNTSSFTESLALFSGRNLIREMSWKGNCDETEKLLPNIEKLLKGAKKTFKDINRIIVLSGPGPFSATRIGVTTANTLAFCLNVPLYGIDTREFWQLRGSLSGLDKTALCMLHAGGNFVGISGCGLKDKILRIEELLRFPSKELVFFGDITENEMREFEKARKDSWQFIPESELKTFGGTVLNMKNLKPSKIVTPNYWQPPKITLPKNLK